MKKITCMLMVAAFGWQTARAQVATPPNPTVLTSAPEFSSWTVELTYADKQVETDRQAKYQAVAAKMAAENPQLAKALAKGGGGGTRLRMKAASVIKTKEIKHEMITFLSGLSIETWRTPTACVTRNQKTATISYAAASGSVEDFPELAWVTPAHFKETRKIKGVDYLVFRGKVSRMQIENPLLLEIINEIPPADTEAEVVVDAGTHLPFSVQTEEVTRIYVFNAPPAEMQKFPAEFASVMQTSEAKLRARLAPVSPP